MNLQSSSISEAMLGEGSSNIVATIPPIEENVSVAGAAPSPRTLFVSSHSVRAKLASNSVWALSGSAFAQGSSLLASFVLGHKLGLAVFGQLALIQATVLLLGNFGEAGLTLTTTKFTGHWRNTDPERAGRLMGWSLRATAMSAMVMTLVLAGVGPYLARVDRTALSLEFVAACGLLVFDMLNRVQFGALAGLEAFEGSARIYFWRGLLTLPCVWLGARYGGLIGAILALGAVSCATFAIGHLVLRRQCALKSITLGYGSRLERGIVGTSSSIWIAGLLLTGSSWFVTVLLSRQSNGFAQLGLFNAADKWRTALLFLPNVLFQVILPMLSDSFARRDFRACRRIVSTTLGTTAAVTGVGVLFVVSFPSVLMSWFGRGFAMGTSVLSMAAFGTLVMAVYTIGAGALWALGKPAQMLGIDIFKTFLLVALCLLGFDSSAWNVMVAQLLSFSAGSAVLMFFVYRQLRSQYREMQ